LVTVDVAVAEAIAAAMTVVEEAAVAAIASVAEAAVATTMA